MEANEKDTCNMQDAEAVVKDCNNNVQYRHYLAKWPNTAIELLEAQLALPFHNIKTECRNWPAEKMYEVIAHHAAKHHQESCWTKKRLDEAKITAIEERNESRNKKWKYDHLPKDDMGHYMYTSKYEYTEKTYIMNEDDVMRLYACLYTTTAMISARKPGDSSSSSM